MKSVILIKPLDGVTAGHPQPSAACFLSKQDCLTRSCTHTHTHLSTQTKTAQTFNALAPIHLYLFLSHTRTDLWVPHSLSITHIHAHTHGHTEPSRPHKSLIFQLCRQATVGSLSPWQGSATQGERALCLSPGCLDDWSAGGEINTWRRGRGRGRGVTGSEGDFGGVEGGGNRAQTGGIEGGRHTERGNEGVWWGEEGEWEDGAGSDRQAWGGDSGRGDPQCDGSRC